MSHATLYVAPVVAVYDGAAVFVAVCENAYVPRPESVTRNIAVVPGTTLLTLTHFGVWLKPAGSVGTTLNVDGPRLGSSLFVSLSVYLCVPLTGVP